MAPTTAIARNADAYDGALGLPGNAEASQAFREMLQARRFVPALEKVGSLAQLPAHITPKVRIPSDNPFTNVPDSIQTPDPGPPPAPGSPLAEAELLAANWDSWGMGSGVNFADRPSSLPQEAKDCLNFFASNPTLLAAIVQDAGGKPGDLMTLADLNQYISDAKGDDELANSLAPPGTPDNPVVSVIKQVVANWHS
jgi:hypothetical protein